MQLIGTGALVLVAPYVAPAVQPLLYASAAVNVGQAGGAEFWRQRKLKKQSKNELALAA